MEDTFDFLSISDDADAQDEKMSRLNHSDLQTYLGFLLIAAYRQP